MYKERFTIIRYHYVTDFESNDYIFAGEESEVGDLSIALEALKSDCWDNIDERETEVIYYPADHHRDLQTGEVTHTNVVIKADKPENLRRLMDCHVPGWKGAI